MKAKLLTNKVLFVLQAKVWLDRKQKKGGPKFKSSCAKKEKRSMTALKDKQTGKLQSSDCSEGGVLKFLNNLELSEEFRYLDI